MNKSMKIILGSALLLISGFAHAVEITITNNTDNRIECRISSYKRGETGKTNWQGESVFVDGKTTAPKFNTKRHDVGLVRVYSSDGKWLLGEWQDRSTYNNYNPTDFTINGDKRRVTISAK